MTYGDIFSELIIKLGMCFKKQVSDFRPATPLYTDDTKLETGIIVWMKDGSKIVYIPKEEKEV